MLPSEFDDRRREGKGHRDSRQRDEQAHGAEQCSSGRKGDEREDHREPRPRHVDARRDETILQDGGNDHQGEQDDRRQDALGCERHDRDGGHGHDGTQVRDEATDEDDDGERACERNAEQRQEHEVRDGIERRHHGSAAEVAADLFQRHEAASGQLDGTPVVQVLRGRFPDPVSVVEEVEGQEAAEDERGHEPGDRSDDLLDCRERPLLHFLDRAVENAQDRIRDPDALELVREAVHAIGDGPQNGGDVGDEREGDEDDRRQHDEEGEHADGARGASPRPSALPELLDQRVHRGRDDERHEDGAGHRRQHDQGVSPDHEQADECEDPPADRRQALQPRRHQRLAGRVRVGGDGLGAGGWSVARHRSIHHAPARKAAHPRSRASGALRTGLAGGSSASHNDSAAAVGPAQGSAPSERGDVQ